VGRTGLHHADPVPFRHILPLLPGVRESIAPWASDKQKSYMFTSAHLSIIAFPARPAVMRSGISRRDPLQLPTSSACRLYTSNIIHLRTSTNVNLRVQYIRMICKWIRFHVSGTSPTAYRPVGPPYNTRRPSVSCGCCSRPERSFLFVKSCSTDVVQAPP